MERGPCVQARPSSFLRVHLQTLISPFLRSVGHSRISNHRDIDKQSRQNGDQRARPREGNRPSKGAGDRKSIIFLTTCSKRSLLTTKQQLLALEKLGALPTPAADEVRNIIAEGIADKFGETYRTFPCAREGIEIRRDVVPKQCALRKSVQGFVAEAR